LEQRKKHQITDVLSSGSVEFLFSELPRIYSQVLESLEVLKDVYGKIPTLKTKGL